MSFSAADVARTTPMLFLTRWITHICAPVFLATAGMAAGLRLARGGSKAELSRYLVTRGLWLIAVELVVMRTSSRLVAVVPLTAPRPVRTKGPATPGPSRDMPA